MHCSKCGYDNTEDAPYCVQCGEPLFMRAKHPTHEQGARKVVKLPSDGSEMESAPIERPWEVRVPKRNAGKPGSSGKMPPARKASGKTGRMPAVKPDANAKGGSEPMHGDETEAKAISGASIGGAAAETLILKPAPGPGETRPDPTPRQKVKSASASMSVKSGSSTRGSGGKGKFAIIIALLLVACAIAAAIFFLTAPKASRVVTFDIDGGSSVAEQMIVDGGKLERPTSPTRDGYSFSGWYLDPSFNDPAYFPITVTEDMTLYAKWSVKSAAASSASSSTSAQTEGANANSGASSSGGSGSKAGAGGSSGGNAGTGSGGNAGGSGSGGSSSGGSGGGSSSDVNSDPASNGPVPITLVASNGATLTGTVTLHDGYVIPDSSTKAYSVSELRALGLNDAELCIARNEPYARQGYSFRNPGLQAYFNARSWYRNTGWRGELPEDSAGYITAHNLLALAQESPSARQWLSLRTY